MYKALRTTEDHEREALRDSFILSVCLVEVTQGQITLLDIRTNRNTLSLWSDLGEAEHLAISEFTTLPVQERVCGLSHAHIVYI